MWYYKSGFIGNKRDQKPGVFTTPLQVERVVEVIKCKPLIRLVEERVDMYKHSKTDDTIRLFFLLRQIPNQTSMCETSVKTRSHNDRQWWTEVDLVVLFHRNRGFKEVGHSAQTSTMKGLTTEVREFILPLIRSEPSTPLPLWKRERHRTIYKTETVIKRYKEIPWSENFYI